MHPVFKLFELYDVENIYVLQQSLDDRELNTARLIIPVVALSIAEFHKTLAQYAIKLMFLRYLCYMLLLLRHIPIQH